MILVWYGCMVMVISLVVDSLAGGSEREEKKRSPGDSHHHLEILVFVQDHILAQAAIITTCKFWVGIIFQVR